MHKVSRFHPPDKEVLNDITLAFYPGADHRDLMTAIHQLLRAVRDHSWSAAFHIGVVVLRGNQHMHSDLRITKPGAEAPGI